MGKHHILVGKRELLIYYCFNEVNCLVANLCPFIGVEACYSAILFSWVAAPDLK